MPPIQGVIDLLSRDQFKDLNQDSISIVQCIIMSSIQKPIISEEQYTCLLEEMEFFKNHISVKENTVKLSVVSDDANSKNKAILITRWRLYLIKLKKIIKESSQKQPQEQADGQISEEVGSSVAHVERVMRQDDSRKGCGCFSFLGRHR